jgi:6-phosphogluconolactonase
MVKVEVVETLDAVAAWAVASLAADMAAAIRAYGGATWVAAGGSTPAAAYRVLAESHDNGIAWNNVRILMGHERCVPPGHPDSNWGQPGCTAVEANFDH